MAIGSRTIPDEIVGNQRLYPNGCFLCFSPEKESHYPGTRALISNRYVHIMFRYVVGYLMLAGFAAIAIALCLAPLLESVLSAIALAFADDASSYSPLTVAVVVLGYKLYPDGALWPPLRLRVSAAADVLLHSRAHTILFSGGVPPEISSRESEAHAMRHYMSNCHPWALENVSNVFLEELSGSTKENALRSLDTLQQRSPHIRHVIVVTNQFHQFRAWRVFMRAAAGRFTISVASTLATTYVEGLHSACLARTAVPLPASGERKVESASASSVRSSHLAHRPNAAFDDSVFSSWHSARGLPQWLHYDSGLSAAHVCGYTLRARAEACCAAADAPIDWDFWGDHRGQMRVLHSVRTSDPWTPGEQRAYLLDSPVLLRSVRWAFQGVGGRRDGARYVVLSQVSLLQNCSLAASLNESARIDVFAPALLRSDSWKEDESWMDWAKASTPWTWRADLTWELGRELLALSLYTIRGWM